MSSHHVVKEDQEPALIIADARAVPFELVQELLEWSPTIIVLEQAVQGVLSWGIKLDVVICVDGRVSQFVELLKDQAPVKILSHQSGEDPLVTAFYFLIAGKYRSVNAVGIDVQKVKPFTRHLDVVTFHDNKRWCYARHGKFEKWLAGGMQIALTTDIRNTEGLDDAGVVLQDGLVKIQAESPFWVGENI